MKIRTQIEKEEGESHEAVKSLLRKYEKFRVRPPLTSFFVISRCLGQT